MISKIRKTTQSIRLAFDDIYNSTKFRIEFYLQYHEMHKNCILKFTRTSKYMTYKIFNKILSSKLDTQIDRL